MSRVWHNLDKSTVIEVSKMAFMALAIQELKRHECRKVLDCSENEA